MKDIQMIFGLGFEVVFNRRDYVPAVLYTLLITFRFFGKEFVKEITWKKKKDGSND